MSAKQRGGFGLKVAKYLSALLWLSETGCLLNEGEALEQLAFAPPLHSSGHACRCHVLTALINKMR